jgi:pimeloyl-ACP methyl ester carboxylesterase
VANTVTLTYTEEGQGTPVVLLHGFPLSSAIWQEQRLRLGDHYRVITPDLRGYGHSPAPLGVYEMDTLARDVLALLDSLGVKKAAIMGHSMGGYVTLALWKIAPERFLAFGLINSQAGADTPEAREGRYKTAEKVTTGGSKVVADSMVPRLFSPDLPTDEPIVEQVRTLILATKPDGIIGSLNGMAARPDSTAILPNINVPVLIITGDKDQIIPPQKADAMASAIPGATLATIENAGHMPMLEQPQATTMAIRNFLAEVSE